MLNGLTLIFFEDRYFNILTLFKPRKGALFVFSLLLIGIWFVLAVIKIHAKRAKNHVLARVLALRGGNAMCDKPLQ